MHVLVGADGPSNLADYRLLRALRAGQPGAFASLWNAHAGPMWSVIRAVCASDAEGVGWMTSLRVELSERAPALSAASALPPQVGAVLLAHLGPERLAPLAAGVPPALPASRPEGVDALADAVAHLPTAVRLLYLADVFFDLTEDAIREAGGARAVAVLTAACDALDPAETDARDEVRARLTAALYRAPPLDVLVLPPGADAPPPPRRAVRWAVAGVLVVAIGGAVALSSPPAVTAEELGRAHSACTERPTFVEGDPVRLGLALARADVSGVLTEAPDLSGAGLTLLGACATDGARAVTLVYRGEDARDWTLHHLVQAPSLSGAVAADGPLDAYAVGSAGVNAVPWRERDTSWALVAGAPPDFALKLAATIREMRGEAQLP